MQLCADEVSIRGEGASELERLSAYSTLVCSDPATTLPEGLKELLEGANAAVASYGSMLRAAPSREFFEGAVTGALAYDKCRLDARKEDRVSCILDKALCNTAAEHARLVAGRVSVEIDARLAGDVEAMVHKAHVLSELLYEMNVGEDRVLFRLPATWEGIHAASRLEKEGHATHLVAVFSLAPQAAAAAHAGVSLIQPSVGRYHAWIAARASVADGGDVTSPRLASEHETLADAKCRDLAASVVSYCRTRGLPAKVMAAARSVSDARALAGVEIILAPTTVLLELAATPASIDGDGDGSLLDRRAAAEVGAAAASALKGDAESCGRRWLENKEAFEETLRENDGGAAYLLEEAVARAANNAQKCEQYFEKLWPPQGAM
jgi:transaldolase